MYSMHKLLWDIRNVPAVNQRFLADADEVLDEYEVEGEPRRALKELDFKAMHELGYNPYLIYFCAIQLQVDRADYYAQIRGEKELS
ncbi:hypothetical protein ACPYO6_01550 [Georgenia sp. Z1344]|uniref:hypothetical protein n=1 Tax=Georgenia sp. Z1344 TaxID=3416706 RepID=UPI003CEDDB6D